MSIDIREIKETLGVRYKDMAGNRMLTNELIIDDLMIALGYNKKRDSGTKRIYDGPIDWELTSGSGSRLAVKVFAIAEEISEDELNDVIEKCKDRRFSILIVTNGENIILYRYDKGSINYFEVCKINLSDELSEQQYKVLESISKQEFNINYIDSLLKKTSVSEDEVLEIIADNKARINETITALIIEKIPECENAVETGGETLNKIIDTYLNPNSAAQNYEKAREEYIKQIEELNNEVHNQSETIELLKKEVSNLKVELDKKSGAAKQRALELLSIIDSTTDDRSYVAIINEEIIQFKELHTFVGRILQKLYELKSFEVQSYIYNGDIFKIKSENSKYNDMIINNKPYDIIIDNNEEDSAFSKLRTIFSHFDDIVFECKKLGKLSVHQDTGIGDDIIENADESIELGETFEVIDEAVASDEIVTEDTVSEQYESSVVSLDKNDDEVTEEIDDTEDIFEDIGAEESNNEENIFTVDDVSDDTDTSEDAGDIFDQLDESSDFSDETSLSDDESDSDNLPDVFDQLDSIDNESDEQDSLYDDNSEGDIDFGESQDESFIEDAESFDNDDDSFGTDEESIDSFNDSINETDSIEGFDSEEDENEKNNSVLLVAQLLNIDKLMCTEQDVKFNNIKYLGSNSVTYIISRDEDEEMTYGSLLCKCVDAVMAIREYEGDDKTVVKLKQKNLSLINNFIKTYSEEYRNCPRINGTRFVVVDIENIRDVAMVLSDICNELQIDTTEMFVYIDAKTESEYILDNYAYDEDAVQIRDTDTFTSSEKSNINTVVLKGDIFNNIIITKNSLKAHSDVIMKTLAVKTKYLAKLIAEPSNVTDVIQAMLSKAVDEKVQLTSNLINSIGFVVGEQYKVVSLDNTDVGEEYSEIDVNGQKIYCAKLKDWQIATSLIRMHTVIFNDASIAVKVQINVDAVNYYGSEYETSEPSTSLAVKSFVDYVASCVK